MKARVLLIVALALVIVGGISAPPAAAGDAVVPFKARYETYPEAELDFPYLMVEIPAAGQATHLGESTFYADMWVLLTVVPNPQWSDNMTLTAANGDELWGTYEGWGTPIPDPEFWGTFEISGGSGRFEGVTGSGAYWGQVTGETGMLYLEGTLTK
ncbi:MAG: hypothetical protein GWN58_13455 [Anaerolineae bacterium]|nr:hypothetical protein [Anaerolineae bacterium]